MWVGIILLSVIILEAFLFKSLLNKYKKRLSCQEETIENQEKAIEKLKKSKEKIMNIASVFSEKDSVDIYIFDRFKKTVSILKNGKFENFDLEHVLSEEPIYPDDEEVRRSVSEKMLAGFSEVFSFPIRQQNSLTGKYDYYVCTAIPVFGDDDSVSSYVVTRKDVTMHSLNGLRVNEYKDLVSYLYLLLDATNMTFWNIDTKMNEVNMLLGKTFIEKSFTIDSFLRKHLSPGEHSRIQEMMRKIMDGESKTIAKVFQFLNEKDKDARTFYRFTFQKGRKENQITCAVQNVTESVLRNEDLVTALAKAEESDRSKLAILANMSHEIRTPLNAIVGFSELLSEAETDKEKAIYVRQINSSKEILMTLIDDILDLSKIENGIELKPERCDFAASFEDLSVSLKSRSSNPEVKFVIENPFNKIFAVVDFKRMAQIITNYTTNAIKHTHKGMIRIGYTYKDGFFEFYVKDTGAGIDDDKKHLVFQRFQKLNTVAQGTGLGLAIVKSLSEKMNLTCGFESTVGKGSYFYVRGPLEMTIPDETTTPPEEEIFDAAPVENVQVESNPDVRILIAEDNNSNYLLISFLLKAFTLVRAYDGQEALDYMKNESFDIVFMDVCMPKLDGLQATTAIREFDTKTPIVALTANAYASDESAALNAGCNAFLSKPVKKHILLEKIKGLTGKI